MSHKKKRNIIIGTLCGVLLLMVVGYAAFNSVLKIKGTSNISSNWDIKITSITSNVLHGSPSNAIEPTGVGTLTATFETNLVSPGDSMQYIITITNNGSMNATLEKITVSKPNNDMITFETSGLTEGSTLTSKGTADLTVTVTYKDIAEGQKQPDNTKGTLSVTLDYVQEGTSGGSTGGIASDYTGTLYSKNVLTGDDNTDANYIHLGDSIEKIKGYTENYNLLGSNYFLKHNITNGQVESSEVCFIKDGLHCLKRNEYETSEAELLNIFGESACTINASATLCHEGLYRASAVHPTGDVRAGDDIVICYVYGDGGAVCYEY